LKAALRGASPEGRIERIEAQLSKLKVNGLSQLRIDKIKELLASVRSNLHDLGSLEAAEVWLREVLALPKTHMGIRVSVNQSDRAKKPRKVSPTKVQLEAFKSNFYAKHGVHRGWINAACLEYVISNKTLNKIIKD